MRRQDDIDGRVEHLSPAASLEELLEFALQSFRDTLVHRAGRRRHNELPVQNLIPVPVRRYGRVVRVVEPLFESHDRGAPPVPIIRVFHLLTQLSDSTSVPRRYLKLCGRFSRILPAPWHIHQPRAGRHPDPSAYAWFRHLTSRTIRASVSGDPRTGTSCPGGTLQSWRRRCGRSAATCRAKTFKMAWSSEMLRSSIRSSVTTNRSGVDDRSDGVI